PRGRHSDDSLGSLCSVQLSLQCLAGLQCLVSRGCVRGFTELPYRGSRPTRACQVDQAGRLLMTALWQANGKASEPCSMVVPEGALCAGRVRTSAMAGGCRVIDGGLLPSVWRHLLCGCIRSGDAS